MPKKPTSLSEVRDGLCQMYEDVMSDSRKAPQVHEGANALGKVIASCKVHLEHCKIAKEKPTDEWSKFIKG